MIQNTEISRKKLSSWAGTTNYSAFSRYLRYFKMQTSQQKIQLISLEEHWNTTNTTTLSLLDPKKIITRKKEIKTKFPRKIFP